MKGRRVRRGVTLIEVLIGVFILGLTTATMVAMFPLTTLMRDQSSGYSRAAMLLHRKLEQIRMLPAEAITEAELRSAGIIDETGQAQAGLGYPFTTVDLLAQELPNGQGFLEITGAGSDLVQVRATLSWSGLRQRDYEVEAVTYVASRRSWRVP